MYGVKHAIYGSYDPPRSRRTALYLILAPEPAHLPIASNYASFLLMKYVGQTGFLIASKTSPRLNLMEAHFSS